MFKEFYSEYFNKNGAGIALKYLLDNTIGKPKYGVDKLVELTAMDFESSFNKEMIPSMIYTFTYESKNIEKIGKAEFTDFIPVILCATNEGGYVTGINFNFLPNDVRAEMLDIIYKAYEAFYTKELSDAVKKGEAIVNEELAGFLINETTRTEFFKILSDKLDYPITSAWRKYDKTKIKNQRLIEFDMWKYIPLLVSNDSVRGAGLVEIQKEIIANK